MAKISLYYRDSGRDGKLIRILKSRAHKVDRSLSSYVRSVLLAHLEDINREARP